MTFQILEKKNFKLHLQYTWRMSYDESGEGEGAFYLMMLSLVNTI